MYLSHRQVSAMGCEATSGRTLCTHLPSRPFPQRKHEALLCRTLCTHLSSRQASEGTTEHLTCRTLYPHLLSRPHSYVFQKETILSNAMLTSPFLNPQCSSNNNSSSSSSNSNNSNNSNDDDDDNKLLRRSICCSAACSWRRSFGSRSCTSFLGTPRPKTSWRRWRRPGLHRSGGTSTLCLFI